jgi:hypothetical protein
MITNEIVLVQYLSKWLADYASKYGRQTFVVVDNGSRQSDLVKFICSEATKITGGLKVQICDTNHIDAHLISNDTFGIVVGLVDRTFGLYYRKYSKLDEGLADIFPLFALEYSEIIQVTDKLFPDREYNDPLDHMMIEFCNKANALYGIITDEQTPNKNGRWPYFLTEQKKWLGFVHQREKATRHKAITKPYPEIPEMLCGRSEL